jgi:hypothetical protein
MKNCYLYQINVPAYLDNLLPFYLIFFNTVTQISRAYQTCNSGILVGQAFALLDVFQAG